MCFIAESEGPSGAIRPNPVNAGTGRNPVSALKPPATKNPPDDPSDSEETAAVHVQRHEACHPAGQRCICPVLCMASLNASEVSHQLPALSAEGGSPSISSTMQDPISFGPHTPFAGLQGDWLDTTWKTGWIRWVSALILQDSSDGPPSMQILQSFLQSAPPPPEGRANPSGTTQIQNSLALR